MFEIKVVELNEIHHALLLYMGHFLLENQ